MKLFFAAIALFSLSLGLSANSSDLSEEPPKIGNFSLPSSQQISPFISFGDNIIDRDQIQLYLFADDLRGSDSSFIDIFPGFLYGISDTLSLFVNVPVAINRDGKDLSSGLQDVCLQVEYAFYNRSSSSFLDQATVVASVSFPSGSVQDLPPTGFGSPGYFLGMTYNRTTIKWLYFTCFGALLNPKVMSLEFGNQYYYQFGLGRLISTWKGWIFAWLMELDGTYSEKNRIGDFMDPNSGGNFVLLTPSLWFSAENLIVQFGVGFPISQNLNGDQSSSNYQLALNIGLTF